MNKKFLIKETIYRLLEEITEYHPGDDVLTNEGEGNVLLSKHPYYSIKLLSNGTTKPFHISKIKKKDGEFGKYDVNESENKDIILLTGILISDTTEKKLQNLLSDIRSILGVTTVRNDDIFHASTYINKSHKTQLIIKIDPYPFEGKTEGFIKQFVQKEILKLSSVRKFVQKTTQISPIKNKTVKVIKPPKKSIEEL